MAASVFCQKFKWTESLTNKKNHDVNICVLHDKITIGSNSNSSIALKSDSHLPKKNVLFATMKAL